MKPFLVVALALTACTASQAQKNAAADSAYTADQVECVKAASTREQADACRAAKRQMWDAGTEAGK
jgi:hypothetical protein